MKLVKKYIQTAWFMQGVLWLGILVYVLRIWYFAHAQRSILDEGLYLYGGYLFASGKQVPFQDYNYFTWQMPLAFLIPGWAQVIFGAGLRTGRYLAIFLSILMLPPLWLTVRRLSGSAWLAVGTIWAMALNASTLKVYSMATSQGLVACLLAWIMFLTLGEDRPPWQLILGSVLTGIALMVRINMLPLLPLLILYLLWERGWKYAVWAGFAGLSTVALIHAPYWPDILKLWAVWLPPHLTPFLNAWRLPLNIQPVHVEESSSISRPDSLFQGFRYQAVPLYLALLTWLLWPLRKDWRSHSHHRMSVYLSILLLVLIGLHAWASLGNSYCVYCFPNYLSFFSGLGFILAAASIHAWRKQIPRLRGIIAAIIILILIAGVAFSAAEVLRPFSSWVLSLPFPRLRDGRILTGFNEFGQTLSNHFGWPYPQMKKLFYNIFPAFMGLILCLLLWLSAAWISRRNRHQPETQKTGRIVFLLLCIAVLVLALLPTPVLGGMPTLYDCKPDAISSYETVGAQLAETIQSSKPVFWRVYNPIILLYTPQIKVNYPQLYLKFNYSNAADADTLLRFGWWSSELEARWLNEADYVLVEAQFFHKGGRFENLLNSGKYTEVSRTPLTDACTPGTYVRILRHNP